MEQKNKYEEALNILKDEISGYYRSPYELHKAVEDLKELIEIDKCKKRFRGSNRIDLEFWNNFVGERDVYLQNMFKETIFRAAYRTDSGLVPRIDIDYGTRAITTEVQFDIYPIVSGSE